MSPRDQVAAAAQQVAEEGLVVGSAGNLSLRVDDVVWVTASGVDLARCTGDDVTAVDLDGELLEGRFAPTSELELHLGVYADTATNAVVHSHAPWSTAVACVVDELPVLHYQQMALGGVIRVAPYATFGTPELADHVRAALVDRQAALMANHGSVAIGLTLEKAVDHALLLEWLAALHHRTHALGAPTPLTDDEQTDVVMAALTRRYGTPQETS